MAACVCVAASAKWFQSRRQRKSFFKNFLGQAIGALLLNQKLPNNNKGDSIEINQAMYVCVKWAI